MIIPIKTCLYNYIDGAVTSKSKKGIRRS